MMDKPDDSENEPIVNPVVQLTDGTRIDAEEATLGSDWVHISYYGPGGAKQNQHIPNERVERVEEGGSIHE